MIDELIVMNMSSEERLAYLIKLIREHNKLNKQFDQLFGELWETKNELKKLKEKGAK